MSTLTTIIKQNIKIILIAGVFKTQVTHLGNSNPSYLELLGLFTVHTNVSTNARLSLQL